MKPPICAVCGERFSVQDGGTIRFANFEPLPEGRVGHPKGLVWFCSAHIEAARAQSKLSSSEAIRALT